MSGKPPGPVGLNYTPLIEPGNMCRVEAPQRTGRFDAAAQATHDELTPIARYMAQEINVNTSGPDVRRLRELNSFSPEQCIQDYTRQPLWRQLLGLGISPQQCIDMQMSYRTAALLMWGQKVMQNGDWDHKPIIARRFNTRSPGGIQVWHVYGNTEYFYDVWSNLHYGYVGAAAGFSDSVLLDGAGLEQIGSDLVRLQRPARRGSTSGLRSWDDPADRAAITMGIQLYRRQPQAVRAQDLLNIILPSSLITRRPFTP
ncbi:MAG TPA: polymorphic toxin type 44 domain-containing protein [Aquabacterium sp.]|uniref:polymorphic toxin type 44 domain-containing protein n=1 Tax=Aquabacterium sp. TaxID=1872578 RepID=UPI002DA4702C|nr:polymorphic toxin type 44 domain-containing protein [Aquabacterium sp.]HET6789400.1 polymorphic toxin type 44 domain-containing protein [Aquabacterium sp.]HEX5371946.1 polymorphic toxin type 44 domain-containing protein [Aquabacterium sp.]